MYKLDMNQVLLIASLLFMTEAHAQLCRPCMDEYHSCTDQDEKVQKIV